ncbi:MAG: CopG family transcriptional regulator [Iamia sp.]
MAKEKVTLTLESELLAEFRRHVDARSLSAAVETALEDRVRHLRHFAAVDEWLAEMEAEDGPISEEAKAWADAVFDRRDAKVAAYEAERRAAREAAGRAG